MPPDPPISRRDLLRGRLARRSERDVAKAGEQEPADGSPLPAPLRPPGAVEEPRFLEGCTRCGECITACPVDAITVAGPRYGPSAGTPIIEPMDAACVMCADTPCISACEPGVLSPDAPIQMGTASIRTANCLAWQGTFCTVCSEQCPVEGAIDVVRGRPTVDEDRCTGCGTCQHVCPAPYNAVLVLPRQGQGKDAPPEPTTTDGSTVDWRAAYFQGRSLRAPEDEKKGKPS